MLPLNLAPFTDRNRFAEFLNDRGLLGKAVEVGTFRAVWSLIFMSNWNGGRLYCVDPYTSGYDKMDPTSYEDMESARNYARNSMKRFGAKVQFIYQPSREAVNLFNDNELDFVYLDGNHQRDHFQSDLMWWWTRVKPGGILAGHDFMCPGEKGGGWGQFIQPVLLKFAAEKELTINLVMEEAGMPWSFYLEKPK